MGRIKKKVIDCFFNDVTYLKKHKALDIALFENYFEEFAFDKNVNHTMS
jgi:hypothetical protein